MLGPRESHHLGDRPKPGMACIHATIVGGEVIVAREILVLDLTARCFKSGSHDRRLFLDEWKVVLPTVIKNFGALPETCASGLAAAASSRSRSSACRLA